MALAERVRIQLDPGGVLRPDRPRPDRRLRPLRLLPADVPDLRAAPAGGDGLAAGPDPADGRARRRNGRALGDDRPALRPLPRLHGLPDLVSFRRPLRPADRADPGLRRGQLPPLGRRHAPARSDLRHGAASAAAATRPRADAAPAAGAARPVRRPEAAVALGGASTGDHPPSAPAGCASASCSAACSGSSSATSTSATARVLAAEGCEVVAPRGQQCCGALHLHAGRAEEGHRRAALLAETFRDVDAIVVNAAGCGSHLKDSQLPVRVVDVDRAARRARARGGAARARRAGRVPGRLPPGACAGHP